MDEVTLTPIDFTLFTGMRAGGKPIPWRLEIRSRPKAMLGFVLKFIADDAVRVVELLHVLDNRVIELMDICHIH